MVVVVTAVRVHGKVALRGVGGVRRGQQSTAGVHPDQGPGWMLRGVSVAVPVGGRRQDRQGVGQHVAAVAQCGERVGVQCQQMLGAVAVYPFQVFRGPGAVASAGRWRPSGRSRPRSGGIRVLLLCGAARFRSRRLVSAWRGCSAAGITMCVDRQVWHRVWRGWTVIVAPSRSRTVRRRCEHRRRRRKRRGRPVDLSVPQHAV